MALEREFLLPADFRATRRPMLYATLLGSCVSVCLRNRHNGHAAMNHFMLDTSPNPEVGDKGRYGDLATALIIDVLFRADNNPNHYEAQVYGGAAVVSHLGSGVHIGQRNILVAHNVLAEYRIKITREAIGGTTGRRIYFNTESGDVEVKQVRKSAEVERLAAQRAELAGRDTRILVVDDSALVRKLLRRVIGESAGFEVCGEAGDAYEARDLILSTDPDVVCLDIIMPGINGLQFLQKLSKHYPLPVVICSTIAKAGSDIAQNARRFGAVGVVDKEELKLYQGIDVVREKLIPVLRGAVGKVRKRRLFQ